MQILPIQTPLIKPGDAIASVIRQSVVVEAGDIVVVSSKTVATAEGAAIDLSAIVPSDDAKGWAQKTGRSAAFCQAVLEEVIRLHGRVLSGVHGAMLTEAETVPGSTVLVPNAGLDESNVDDGYTVGWPVDPVRSAKNISDALKVAVIISDSFVVPRRSGVTAFALTACGMDPVRNDVGKTDLFGHQLMITKEAIADQLAVMGNAVMGNANQSIPAAIIRDHHIPLSDFCGWVPGIPPEEDLFTDML